MATVNLKQDYSALNETLIKVFDESGVKRSFTVPYIEGQEMADHINSVAAAAKQTGGLTTNLIMSAHHSSGKGWGSGEGHTVGHSTEKLRQTTIPQKDPHAKAAIAAAQTLVNDLKFLMGDDEPTVQEAQGHLNLVKPTNAQGMSLFDFGSMLIAMFQKPLQAVARLHSGTKKGGHSAQLRGPEAQQGQEQPSEAQGEAQPAGETSEAQASPETQGEAPAASEQAQG